jgi:biotin carboxyl carrier protein
VKYAATVDGRSFEIEVDHDGLVRVDGQPLYVRLQQLDGLPLFSLALENAEHHLLYVDGGPGSYRIEIQGNTYPVEVRLVRSLLEPPVGPCDAKNAGEACVRAPLAGRLLDLPIPEGESVEPGQVVALLESMKMQIELRAPRAGTVNATYGPVGRDVSQGESLVLIRCAPGQSP